MKEVWFQELGFFSKRDCETIKDALDGTTYMNFKVIYSNMCGNCSLGVATDYDAPEDEIKNFFLNAALSTLCGMARR